MPQGHCICRRATRPVCPAIPLAFGPIWCLHLSLSSSWHLAECGYASGVVLGHRRAEGPEEGWVSLKQSGMEVQEPIY